MENLCPEVFGPDGNEHVGVQMRNRAIVAGAVVALAAAALTPAAANEGHRRPQGPARSTIVFNGEGNNLDIYDVSDLGAVRHRTLIHAFDGERGRDINAQICFHEHKGKTYFIAGEDTGQGDQGAPGWGWFELKGKRFDRLRAVQRGKLVPEWVPNQVSGEENYGCGFLGNGDLVTSEVGDQFPGLPDTGELILWFADRKGGFGRGFRVVDGIPRASSVPHCHLDTDVSTSGGILVRHEGGEDVVYLASNRPGNDGEPGGVYRYSNLPTAVPDDPAGCEAQVTKELAIPAAPITGITPSAVAEAPNGHFYMSSVFDGVISEWAQGDDGTWAWVRNLIDPPAGTPVPQLGDSGGAVHDSLTTEAMYGTPFGIGVGPDGTIYYADIGILLAQPAPGAGDVYAITFDDAGDPHPPTRLNSEGQEFPDGIGVIQLHLVG